MLAVADFIDDVENALILVTALGQLDKYTTIAFHIVRIQAKTKIVFH